ncbi:hypothetical protein L6452_05168 [Arctium lappa]|uniref:Uncharacterized protein n=1 Tax=Arctium lappa TaxID=4217 RepID=A0ACB9EFY3_ARCLA|nr:hypothetical protein L6452_05168 [Arctium lappa]
MDDNNEGGRRSNRIKIKRSSKVSNNADDTIVNDYVGEGEGTPEDTTGKPKMVTTSSGVRVILPSVTHDRKRKNLVKDKSNKSPDKRKSSKSPVKNKSSKSTVRVTSPETNDGAVVVESIRKTRSKTRETTVQRVSKKTKHGKGMDTGSAECRKRVRISDVMKKVESTETSDFQFKLNFLVLFLSTMAECNSCGYCNSTVLGYITHDTDISKIDWSKYVFNYFMRSKDQWRREISSETFYSGPITFLLLLYADITRCKKFDVERTRPTICVWNMELLRRREYLELTDGGFGTWPLLVQGDVPDDENRTNDVFAKRSTRSKVSSKAKLQECIKSIESKMNSIMGSDHEQNNEHGFETPRRTKDSKQDQPTRITDNDPTPNESVGLELVPGVPLETEAYWNNPTIIMEIDNSCIDYYKKRKIDRDAIPKFDLGISSKRKYVIPLPISSIIPITKGMFILNSRVKAICDAPRLGKREAKPGEALRSPYVKRTVDIDTLETSSEKKTCAWINAVVEPVCEPVFETTTGTVALRGTVESLSARTEIYNNTDTMLKPDTSPELKVKIFADNILASVGGDAQVITFKGVDLVFFPIIRDMHFFVVVFNFKRPSILIIDNIQQELETPAKFEEIPDLLERNQKDNLCFS